MYIGKSEVFLLLVILLCYIIINFSTEGAVGELVKIICGVFVVVLVLPYFILKPSCSKIKSEYNVYFPEKTNDAATGTSAATGTTGGAATSSAATTTFNRALPSYEDPQFISQFPTDFGSQNQKYNFNTSSFNIPDGWSSPNSDIARALITSQNKYDIDNKLINGNSINPFGRIPENRFDFENQTKKKYGDDMYTAASLHFSRKPQEAFYYQSRWGVNSLRPWLSQELDDHANKIWWENADVDLDQFM